MGELYTDVMTRARRISVWRAVFIVCLLLCFTGLQSASVVLDHAHEHGNAHSSCPICHATHVPALHAIATVQVPAPGSVSWRRSREDVPVASTLSPSLNSSRAPPA